MDNYNVDKNTGEQTDVDVHKSVSSETGIDVNEVASVSKRGGRKGRSSAAQLGPESSGGSSSSQGEVFRVVISKGSNEVLESALRRCVDGFDSGSLTKSDVANYVFQNLNKFFSASDVQSLRATHFDEKKMLGTILRTESDLPEELKKAIRAHYGITDKEKEKKRLSRAG